MDDLGARFRALYDVLLDDQPDPPQFDTISEPLMTVGKDPRRSVLWPGLAAATVTLAVFGFGALFLTDSGPFASLPIVEHLVIEYTQDLTLECTGMEIADDGGADEITIDLWVDYQGQDARMRMVGSDGSTYEVLFVDGLAFPIREWASGQPIGRRASCYTQTAEGTSHLNATGPMFDIGGVSQFMDPDASYYDALRDEATTRGWREQGEPVLSRTVDSRGRLVSWFVETREIEGVPDRIYRTEWAIDSKRRLTEYVDTEESVGLFVVSRTMVLLERASGEAEPGLFSTTGLDLRRDVADVVVDQSVNTTTSIAPVDESIMDDAEEITPDEIPDSLAGLADPSDGDRFYRVETDTAPVFVKLRPLEQAFLFGQCETLGSVELPVGWRSECIEE